jgi:hypothetical protein
VPLIDRHQLTSLADRQDCVASRTQLRVLGVDADHVAGQVRAGRWRAVGPNAVLLHNGPPTLRQTWWLAVVNAGPHAALCAFTALAADGLTGWEREPVHVLVPRGTTLPPLPGVKVHESRRYDPVADIHPTRLPPRTTPARSAVDAATWSRRPRKAVGVLAAAVQQRLTRAEDLQEELATAGRIRHLRLLMSAAVDIGGGSQALSEIDFVRLCRRFGLPEPVRQSVRVEASGRRRYLDAEWRLPDGRVVVAEVDGALHLLPDQWWDDMERDNSLVLDGRLVLRFPAFVVRSQQRAVAIQLARALAVDLSG